MKKLVLAALLAATLTPAVASQYYVVVPVPNRTPSAGNLLVSLNAYNLPQGLVGEVYAGFNFNTVLQVLGDPSFSASNVRWSVVGGALPAGLSLSADGRLSGTPTAAAASNFQVMAAYKTKAGQQTYTVTVNNLVVSLGQATLPDGKQGAAYSYDLKQNLSISGDEAYSGSGVTWSVTSGSLPAGLSLGANGGGWTLVARSGGTVVSNATYCNSGLSGVNTPFGWTVARGTPADTTNPYSMGVFSRNLTFTEVLIGGGTGNSNAWSSYVYQQVVPANFKTAWSATDTTVPSPGFGMSTYMGHTVDTTQYFFRDVPEGSRGAAQSYGLHADGWQTCYGDGPNNLSQSAPASFGGNLNYRHGMLMVR
ncbi:putative Ig domain-containing protein [Burkholderia ubonensis]|uniref:putative Ig domain-containing protein n=1 Tax=Burkholderia ubonensis TaxID=101571 RepID=UPI0007531BFA|nr:putative Ig domain-containing protein [Burkholderia ubonensis]KVP39663.1 hypothetical protein WJ87_05630 [Burkholderia ubonensis]